MLYGVMYSGDIDNIVCLKNVM